MHYDKSSQKLNEFSITTEVNKSTELLQDSAFNYFTGKEKKIKQVKNKSVIKELISSKLTFRLQLCKNKNKVVVEIWILIELF